MENIMETEATHTGTSMEDISARLLEKWTSDDEPTEKEVIQSTEPEPEKVAAEVEGDEPEEVADEKAEEAEQEPEEAEEEAAFQTISELAEALELDPDEFMDTLKAKVKVNGQENEVTLAEAFKGYQREADYTRKTQEVAEERRQLEAEQQKLDEANQQWTQQMNEAIATVDAATSAVLADFQSVDWDRLKVEDPTQFVIREREYQQRHAQLQQQKQAIVEHNAQVQQQRMAEMLPKEQAALKAAIPEWHDESVFESERKDIADYAIKQGYSKEQIDGLVDHKAVVMLRKAMLYDKAMSKPEPEPVKKVTRKITKSLKPGARTNATTVKQDALEKARKRLKRTGSERDMAAVLLERWS
jgi:uncharacterized phage infection (PIP) family protein YhgE